MNLVVQKLYRIEIYNGPEVKCHLRYENEMNNITQSVTEKVSFLCDSEINIITQVSSKMSNNLKFTQ